MEQNPKWQNAKVKDRKAYSEAEQAHLCNFHLMGKWFWVQCEEPRIHDLQDIYGYSFGKAVAYITNLIAPDGTLAGCRAYHLELGGLFLLEDPPMVPMSEWRQPHWLGCMEANPWSGEYERHYG